MNISVLYGVIAVLSLLLMIGYFVFYKNKEIWLSWIHIFVFIINFGYFALSIAKSLEWALWANRITYFGAVFLPMCMLLAIVGVCRISYGKLVPIGFIALGAVIFFIAASPGYFDWYYKEVSIVFVNGIAKLKKVYGPLHSWYYVYLISYFFLMVGIILWAMLRKKMRSWKHAALLAVVVLLNIAIWMVEQFINYDFEFLSVSYLISELLLLFLYGMLRDYEKLKNITARAQMKAVADAIDIEVLTTCWPEVEMLSKREKEVLKGMLQEKKRKEIAEELCITENTVKKHVTNIFSKLHISNRKELYEQIRQKSDVSGNIPPMG